MPGRETHLAPAILPIASLGLAIAVVIAACGADPGRAPSGSSTARPSRASPPASVVAPGAVLRGADGATAADAPAAGVVGSWAVDGAGADSPWLPAAMLAERSMRAGTPLLVAFADGQPIGAWQAVVAAATDVAGDATLPLGGRETGAPPLTEVAVAPLEPGRWVLSVRLDRADGRGGGTFYWLVGAT